MNYWNESVEKIRKYVVRIETQTGYGTGFLFLYNEDRSICGIATANHVLEDADIWQQPLRVRNLDANKEVLLKEDDRVIFRLTDNDLAVILFDGTELDLPQGLIPLLPSAESIKIGAEVGWLGFPNIDPSSICFFSGIISARKEHANAYLIDGVAINGVSGGPVFHCTQANGIEIIGIVSAYHPNRATGDTLPGLLRAQDVSKYHDIIGHVKSLDEANRKKKDLSDLSSELVSAAKAGAES